MSATILMPLDFALASATWTSLSTLDVVLVRTRPRPDATECPDGLAEIIPLFGARRSCELNVTELLSRRPRLVVAEPDGPTAS